MVPPRDVIHSVTISGVKNQEELPGHEHADGCNSHILTTLLGTGRAFISPGKEESQNIPAGKVAAIKILSKGIRHYTIQVLVQNRHLVAKFRLTGGTFRVPPGFRHPG